MMRFSSSVALYLVVLAAIAGAAAGTRVPAFAIADDAPHGRALQQARCQAVPNCKTCHFRRRGTTTVTVCSECNAGFSIRNFGRSCWCAPGFKWSDAQATCVPCNDGLPDGQFAWCPGSTDSLVNATAVPCGDNLHTTSAFAKYEKDCVSDSGYGLVNGTAEICDYGSYNSGGNNRQCTKCPGGLTTVDQGAASAASCVAAPGYMYFRGKAVPCAMGTFKPTTDNVDCSPCPLGFTTNRTGAENSTLCNILKPGFSSPAGAAGVVVGEYCLEDTYRATNYVWDDAAVTNGVACDPCPTACTTNGVFGAKSLTKCISPEGYGWNGEHCLPCDLGFYSPGFNREPCIRCGTGITTEEVGAISEDMCVIPAGFGTSRDATTGALSAAACPVDTYGREDPTFGMVDVECTKCMDNTRTNDTGNKNPGACVAFPGYGWDNGAINECDYGYWSAGGDKNPCTYCGDGRNTSNPSDSKVPATTATGSNWCVTAAGWTTDNAGGIKPCVKGSYKSDLGNGPCISCSTWGLTTSMPYGAYERASCDACLPGYGTLVTDSNIMGNGSFASLETAACSQCKSGYYSTGGAQGGAFCERCPESDDYQDVMVSKPGSSTPDSCVRQFASSNSSLINHLEWDILPMMASALTVQPSATDIVTCQVGCQSNPRCQYFVFYNYGTDSARCHYRVASSDIVKVSADVTTPSGAFYVMIEVKEGLYVTYTAASSADTTAIGTTIGTFGNFEAAHVACDKDTGCAGFANTADNSWRTFRGSKWEGAVGKVRAVGEAINSWIL